MLITGASRGIGAATARLAAAAGYDVVVNFARDEAAAADVVGECRARGARAFAHRADVADETQVVGLFERAVEEYGRVDVLVNNAGILHQQMRFERDDRRSGGVSCSR